MDGLLDTAKGMRFRKHKKSPGTGLKNGYHRAKEWSQRRDSNP